MINMFDLSENKYSLHIIIIAIFLVLSLCTVVPVLNMVLLGAMIAYGLTPIAKRFQSKIKYPSISIFLAIILVIIPLILLFAYVFWEIAVFANMFFTSTNLSINSGFDMNSIINTFVQALPVEIQGMVKPHIGSLAGGLNDLFTHVLNYVVKLLRNFSDILVQLFVLVCSIYYFTRDGDEIWEYIFVFIPEKHKPFFDKSINEVANVLKSIFYGHFLTAVIIGVLGGVGYYLLGYKFALFLGIVTGIAQLVPIFGPWIVYWALAIYSFFILGDVVRGVLTVLWGFVLSLSDMYTRPMLASNYADMPSLILLVGFMAGPYVFGIVGFILGPLILGITYALIKSLKEEFEKDKLENKSIDDGSANMDSSNMDSTNIGSDNIDSDNIDSDNID